MNLSYEHTEDKVTAFYNKRLERILSENEPLQSLSNFDLMFVILINIMIENGFIPNHIKPNSNAVVKDFCLEDLLKWKLSTKSFQTTFFLLSFESTPVTLLMSHVDILTVVNVIITDTNPETYTICVPVTDYVVSSEVSKRLTVCNIQRLTSTFKDKILSTVKSRVLNLCGYTSASLVGIPEEVLTKIILNLPVCDILSLSQVCKHFQMLMEKDSIWRELFKRDFPILSNSELSWQELYKQEYREQQNKKLKATIRDFGNIHDLMDYADYVTYIDNPLWVL